MTTYGDWVQPADYDYDYTVAGSQLLISRGSLKVTAPSGSQGQWDATWPPALVPDGTTYLVDYSDHLEPGIDGDNSAPAFSNTMTADGSSAIRSSVDFVVPAGVDLGPTPPPSPYPDGVTGVEYDAAHPTVSYVTCHWTATSATYDGTGGDGFPTAVGEAYFFLDVNGLRTIVGGPKTHGYVDSGDQGFQIPPDQTLVTVAASLDIKQWDLIDPSYTSALRMAVTWYPTFTWTFTPPRYRYIYGAAPVPATFTPMPPARITGRGDGLGPLGGARRMDTYSPSQQTGFRPGAPASYY